MATKPKRRPGTVAAVNRAIDAMNRKANPPKKRTVAKTRLVQRKANPVRPTVTDRKKQLPDFRYLVQIEGTSGDGDWFSEAAFRLLSRAEEYARFLHRKHPRSSVRVLARD